MHALARTAAGKALLESGHAFGAAAPGSPLPAPASTRLAELRQLLPDWTATGNYYAGSSGASSRSSSDAGASESARSLRRYASAVARTAQPAATSEGGDAIGAARRLSAVADTALLDQGLDGPSRYAPGLQGAMPAHRHSSSSAAAALPRGAPGADLDAAPPSRLSTVSASGNVGSAMLIHPRNYLLGSPTRPTRASWP